MTRIFRQAIFALLIAALTVVNPTVVTAQTISGGSPATVATTNAAQIRPARIACIGDSIARYTCRLANNSWLFWALASQPRRIDFEPTDNSEGGGLPPAYLSTGSNFGVAGASSGTGSCTTAGAISTSMNCPNKLAAVAAYNPDILIVWVGANESGTGSAATVANIQSAVNSIIAAQPTPRLRAVILVPTAPRTGGSQGATGTFTPVQLQSIIANRQAALQLERTSSLYHVLDIPALMIDPTAAGYSPTGCCTATTATAATADGIHPSPYTAIITGLGSNSPANRLLDVLAVDRIVPRMNAPGDYWDATNAPYGQLISSETGTGGSVSASVNQGLFVTSGGTSTGIGATSSPAYPTGWQGANGSSNAELLWTATINNAVTDQFGRTRRAYNTVFSSTSALTADRTWNQQYRPSAAKLTAGAAYEATVHAKIKAGCKGLTSLSVSLQMQDTGSGHGSQFITENAGDRSGAYLHDWTADLLDPWVASADLDLDLVIPTYTIPTGATTNTMFFQMNASFLSGSLGTGNTCEIDWSDAQMHRVG